jgi:DNA-binding protein HU-beta
VNRTELADAVSARIGLDKKRAEAAVEAMTDEIVAAVKAGQRVSVFGFGTFEPRSRAARTARNPRTQAIVPVPASKSVAFKPAAAFKSALNSRTKAGAKKTSSTAKAATTKKAGAARKAGAAKKAAPAKKATTKRATSAKAAKSARKR